MSASAADGPGPSTTIAQKHRRRRSRRYSWIIRRRRRPRLARGVGLLVSWCAVCGVVGRGNGVCFPFADRRFRAGFHSGVDLLVSAGRDFAWNCPIGVVSRFCWHHRQHSQAALDRQPLGITGVFLFFGILGGLSLFGAMGIILGPVLFALLRALLDLYLEEYASAEQKAE